MTELNGAAQPQGEPMVPADREPGHPSASGRPEVEWNAPRNHLPRRIPRNDLAAPVNHSLAERPGQAGATGGAAGGAEGTANVDDWLEETAHLGAANDENGPPSLPPRGELVTLAFTLEGLETELESLLYRLAFDPGSWVMEVALLRAANHCHLRVLVYEDASAIAEILAADDRPTPLPNAMARSMLALGWEPPSRPAHPIWMAGTPSTHSTLGGLSNMIIATLKHVLGFGSHDRLGLTLYGA